MNWALADLLEKHEETGNAELARRIGGEVWERSDAIAIFSHPELGTGLNFVCRVRSNTAAAEKLADELTEWLAARGVAPHFRVSPLTQPSTFVQILERRGFDRTERETQMVLAGPDVEPPTNPRVAVERAQLSDLTLWVAIQHRAFGGSDEPSPLTMQIARTSAIAGNSTPYLARLEGQAVGAGVLLEWAGALGIYGVAVEERARGQGVGTAMVRQMMRDTQARGNMPLCLQVETGEKTQRWYERLGFRVVYDRTGWTQPIRAAGDR